MFQRMSKKTPIDKRLTQTNVMFNRVTGVTIALLVLTAVVSASTLVTYNIMKSEDSEPFIAKVDFAEGTNHYTLVEIDEGDNDEEQSVTMILHEFLFSVTGEKDTVAWDFGDGNSGNGEIISHQYQEPGNYVVTATTSSPDSIETVTIDITVNLVGSAEVDNMECTCAPTAKDTVIDLMALPLEQSIAGYVKVEHDGSSESCSLRNPLQECHIRVVIQWTEEGSVIAQEVLFDDTFRSNELVVDFSLDDLELEQGKGLQLRLETDQLRDWHKPSAEWYNTVLQTE